MATEQRRESTSATYTVTNRGFRRYAPTTGANGRSVEVFESSAADAPHLWLTFNHGQVHLTLEQAQHLRDTLDVAVREHYQLREDDDSA